MKRKLLAVLLSGVAILTLLGAGLEQSVRAAELADGDPSDADAAAVLTQEAPASEPVLNEGAEELQEEAADPEPEDDLFGEPDEEEPEEAEDLTQPEVPDAAQEAGTTEQAPEPELPRGPELDTNLVVDGQPVPVSASRMTVGNMTYVSLSVMAREIDPSAEVTWDAVRQQVTVKTERLTLTAVVGQLYLTANDRYLYLPDGVQLIDGRAMVSLDAVAKAFGAVNGWDAQAGTFTVTRGSGAIVPGSKFYDKDSLFWLSRVIMAESGNQSLKGKMAVGNVVLNRVNGSSVWPDTILGVLAQKNQFTTYRNGALAKRTPNAQSVIAAKLVLDGGVVQEVAGAVYFDSGKNTWASRNRPYLGTIGGHKFYG